MARFVRYTETIHQITGTECLILRRSGSKSTWRSQIHWGQHVGTVEKIEDDRIKLTRSDARDHMHHFNSLNDVEIDDNHICLKATAPVPPGLKLERFRLALGNIIAARKCKGFRACAGK